MTNNYSFYQQLHTDGLIGDESFAKITHREQNPLLSVHREVKAILYLGILLLTTGLGILIYKNIDTIGHQVILLLIAAISGGCFAYCFKNKRPFSTGKAQSPSAFFDYILLLATITFVTFIGYLQYQYNIFGSNYGLATFIPMLALFYIAYSFDHIGILTMAIINLGVWMGVSVTPKQLILAGTFSSQPVINTYLTFGLLLIAAALASQKLMFKSHFKFTYYHYGVHVTFISLLAGYFFNYRTGAPLLWILGVFILAGVVFKDAYKHKQFYFLLLTTLYSYFAFSCLLVQMLDHAINSDLLGLLFLYFTITPVLLIIFLIKLNKKLKSA
jgi:hypothetical protein